MFYFPPYLQRFLRGKTWWNFISNTPADFAKYLTIRHPGLGLITLGGIYYYYWAKPLKQAEIDRFDRWRNNWKAEVHIQENKDWGTRKAKDEMREFILAQKAKYGSFKEAIAAYEEKTGETAPPILTDDIVYDYALKRVGVDINDDGNEEPTFLWDGTGYLNDRQKPLVFADGKHAIPKPPSLYV